MLEAIVIIIALGGLELALWMMGHREAQKQTRAAERQNQILKESFEKQNELLEDIAVGLFETNFGLDFEQEIIEVAKDVVPN